jgi:hypothetical protein
MIISYRIIDHDDSCLIVMNLSSNGILSNFLHMSRIESGNNHLYRF